jgi:hypothetical protein
VAGGALAAVLVVAAVLGVATFPADAAVSGVVRVDQVGFLAGEAKQAYLMTTARVACARFEVVDSSGTSALSGAVGATSRGSWNKAYPAVYPIQLAGLTKPGTYQIRVSGAASARSPKFKVLEPAALYGKLVADGVTFFQTQRDGRDVLGGPLNRQPAHLNDEPAIDMTGSAVVAAALQEAAASGGQAGPLVALAVTGMPSGVTVALAPATVGFGQHAKMMISALPGAAAGTYPLTVTGTGLNLKTRTTTVKLTVG